MYRGGALPPKSLYSIYTAQGAQCNTTHALHTILHGITSLGSNPRPLASAALAPPPGRSISAGGNVLVGFAADPSGPPRRQGPVADWIPGYTARHPRWALRRHGPAAGPAAASVSSFPPALHLEPPPLPRNSHSPAPTSAAAPLP
jgi:hypothetical protein